jgi:N-acetylmuramoyl-L-alanine amidase
MKVVISSGHGKYIRGASGYIDEVDEARKVVNEVAALMNAGGTPTTVFHDDISTTQSENLNRIVAFHNSKDRDWDISVHFNAYQTTSSPMGTEVLYVSDTGKTKAKAVVDGICTAVPFINRGPKYRDNLAFLNNTEKPAILIETCFVDSQADVNLYRREFDAVCQSIATSIVGGEVQPGPVPPQPPTGVLFQAAGRCSHFGGPEDTGVSPSEGLAFISNWDQVPHLFLPYQPQGTTGLARRLNPWVPYIACRWDYNVTSKTMLRDSGKMARVRAPHSGFYMDCFPADWGPNENTGRVADLSPGMMEALGLTTDDQVEVEYPCPD